MRIEVVGRNLEITPAIREYASAKAAKLSKYFDGIQLVTFRLSKEDHQHHGKFGVELVVDVEKHEDFISKEVGEDLYAVIDSVVQKGSRQVSEFKEQLKKGRR